MKTITLWNVPLEVAQIAVKELRALVSAKIVAGVPMEEVKHLVWEIENWEESIRKELEGTEE